MGHAGNRRQSVGERRVQDLRDQLRNLMVEQIESLKTQKFGDIGEEEVQKEHQRLNRIREVSADFLLALKNRTD